VVCSGQQDEEHRPAHDACIDLWFIEVPC